MAQNSLIRRIIGIISAGIFLLLPVAVVIILLGKLYNITIGPVEKLAALFGMERLLFVRVLLWTIILLVCFILGLLIKAQFVTKARDYLEGNILRFVPGYEFVKLRLNIMLKADAKAEPKPVLVRIDDGWSPAFLMEEGSDGNLVVFVPDVPKSSSGAVYVIEPERVKRLEAKFKDLDLAVRNYGKGLGKITENVDLRVPV